MAGHSHIDSDASVGPFARLRLDAEVGAGAHVGNFVELKKTRMGPGAKANHLAYLGDSAIGEKVNIGAGTITCNYDGANKFRTIIEVCLAHADETVKGKVGAAYNRATYLDQRRQLLTEWSEMLLAEQKPLGELLIGPKRP